MCVVTAYQHIRGQRELTGDLIWIDASNRYRGDALVHAWLMSAVQKVPDINAAVLLGDVEHRRSTGRPVSGRQPLG